MVVFGYAKGYQYAGDGTLQIKVRIPTIHGPYDQRSYKGQRVRNYIGDGDLPYYPSVLLPHLPNEGEVVVLSTMNETPNDWIIIGMTGGYYMNDITEDN